MNSSGTANENVICVDKLWLNFKSAFLKVADRHAPLLQKRVRGVDNCPWMTGQIKKDIRQRGYFLKKARKSSFDEDWLAYKSMRNRVTNMTNFEARKNFMQISWLHIECTALHK